MTPWDMTREELAAWGTIQKLTTPENFATIAANTSHPSVGLKFDLVAFAHMLGVAATIGWNDALDEYDL